MIVDLTRLSKADAGMEQLYWLLHGPMQVATHAKIIAGGIAYTIVSTAAHTSGIARMTALTRAMITYGDVDGSRFYARAAARLGFCFLLTYTQEYERAKLRRMGRKT